MPDMDKITPLPIPGIADYHCHCDYSIDAEGTIEQYCEAARRRGLSEICFTTHYDTNPVGDEAAGTNVICVNGTKLPATPENLTPYVDHVRRAGEEFYPLGLSVKLGVEISWYEGCDEQADKLVSAHDFDYVLAGLHELDDICLCCRHTHKKLFDNYSPERLVEAYYRQMVAAARTGLFDSLAHGDYYLRYGRAFYGDAIKNAHLPFIDELFRALVDTDTCLEVNTSGIRHGHSEYYPHMDIVNRARKAGVNIPFLGSDSHSPEQIGLDFEAAVAVVPPSLPGFED